MVITVIVIDVVTVVVVSSVVVPYNMYLYHQEVAHHFLMLLYLLCIQIDGAQLKLIRGLFKSFYDLKKEPKLEIELK